MCELYYIWKQGPQQKYSPHLIVLGVSALHYSTRSQNLEGVQTVASAHALHNPLSHGLSISIASDLEVRI